MQEPAIQEPTRRKIPYLITLLSLSAPVAQLIEYLATNQGSGSESRRARHPLVFTPSELSDFTWLTLCTATTVVPIILGGTEMLITNQRWQTLALHQEHRGNQAQRRRTGSFLVVR